MDNSDYYSRLISLITEDDYRILNNEYYFQLGTYRLNKSDLTSSLDLQMFVALAWSISESCSIDGAIQVTNDNFKKGLYKTVDISEVEKIVDFLSTLNVELTIDIVSNFQNAVALELTYSISPFEKEGLYIAIETTEFYFLIDLQSY